MKKMIFICALAGIACFGAGYFTSLKVNSETIESSNYKIELIKAQEDALEKANVVMNNNQLWDLDGSDEMADYLEASCKVDSLIRMEL